MKTPVLLVLAFAIITGVIAPDSAKAQSFRQTPTVRYEGRPVETIVRNGIPVRNYDGDGRVVLDETNRRIRSTPVRPVITPPVFLIWQPWRVGLPFKGPRFVWGQVGLNAVLYDRVTGQAVYVKHNWFR
jgi:hypothetical protein